MTPNKISIITVCFNAEKTIEKTIQSVITQTYKNIEYIIIDGASNDSTVSVIEQLKSESITIISEPDSGIYNAMNKGIKASTGDYLLFLNADDHLLSNTVIENFIAKIKDNCEADIFYGDLLIYNHTNGTGKIWKAKQVSGKTLYNSTLPHPSTIYCRSIFEELGGYNESFKITADHDFFVQAYVKGKKIQYINILATLFSTGGISTSKNYTELLKEERRRTINTHFTPSQRFLLRIRVRIKKLINI
jgi:glycosyltransferase involved in cell wall biosynthesis